MDVNQFAKAAGIAPSLAQRWHPHIEMAMLAYNISTPQRQADFIAQLGHESMGFTRLSESFNYSVAGLMATFPRSRLSEADCNRLGRKAHEKSVPEHRQREIANLVYGKRYGNLAENDGWRYRGRGLKQITFKENYRACGIALGLDLIGQPELLLEDKWAAMSAGWFWAANNLSDYADRNDFIGQTKVINGGTNGLMDRRLRRERALDVLLA